MNHNIRHSMPVPSKYSVSKAKWLATLDTICQFSPNGLYPKLVWITILDILAIQRALQEVSDATRTLLHHGQKRPRTSSEANKWRAARLMHTANPPPVKAGDSDYNWASVSQHRQNSARSPARDQLSQHADYKPWIHIGPRYKHCSDVRPTWFNTQVYIHNIYTNQAWYSLQSSGAVWKSRWPSWTPVPNKPTVSVDVKRHFNVQF